MTNDDFGNLREKRGLVDGAHARTRFDNNDDNVKTLRGGLV